MESFTLGRSREDVENTLAYAKLDVNEMRPLAQCLQMAPNLDNDSIKLVELENNVLESLLAGNRLVIRGAEADSAVLCTSNETFEMKEAETSNSLLILPQFSITADELEKLNNPLAINRQVCALKHNYYELRRIKPRLKRLKDLLEETPFSGDQYEADKHGHKFTHAELLETIQASDAELRQGLRKLNACLVNDCWRLLDVDYTSSVLTSILAAIEEMSWEYDSIVLEPLISVLQELYPSYIVLHVLECFATAGDGSRYQLNEDLVCRFFAELLLHAAHRYNLTEFEEAWQLAVPDGMKTNLHQLEGLALIDRNTNPETICYFPVDELPEEIDDRFQTLFKTKEKWTLEEIMPYLVGLCVDGKVGVGTLLTKFARVSTQKGIKLYSSRK